jgi:ABC-type nitrate/sulfonate/bicarbonate transport system substrate-binding protein
MRLKANREQAIKVLRAIVRGLRFIRERRDEVIPITMRWLDHTRDVAAESYDLILPSFSADGGTSNATYQFAIESRKSSLKTDRTISLSQVRDLSLLKEVQRELGLQ